MARSVHARYADGASASTNTPIAVSFLSIQPESNSKPTKDQSGVHPRTSILEELKLIQQRGVVSISETVPSTVSY